MFERVITESGSALAPWAYDDKDSEFHARKIGEKVGCTNPDLNDFVTCMRQVPYANLTQADLDWSIEQNMNGGLGFGGHDPCGQTKGAKKFILHGDSPTKIFEEGRYRDMPTFYGANLDEGLLPFRCKFMYSPWRKSRLIGTTYRKYFTSHSTYKEKCIKTKSKQLLDYCMTF